MARAKEHGNGKLEEALQALIQAQATLVNNQAAFQAEWAETQRDLHQIKKESDDRFRAFIARFEHIEAILLEHNRILSRLADTVGEKIGFKASQTPTSEE